MAHSEFLKSVKAAVAAAAVVWGLYFLTAVAFGIARGRAARSVWSAAWQFGIYGAVFLVSLLLFLVPLLQLERLRRLGAAFSVPVACLLAGASLVVLSLYFADPGDGDPSTVAGVVALLTSRPLESLFAFVPFIAASALFPWARRHAGHS